MYLIIFFSMIDDESTNILIRWSRDGKSFLGKLNNFLYKCLIFFFKKKS